MGRTSPECLSSAGGLFVAAGFIAALTGGLYGLQAFRPGFVVLSVLLVMGFSVTGYLLHSKRDAAFGAASALAALLVIATIGVFQAGAFPLFGHAFTYVILFPATGYLLALGTANLVAYGLARRNPRVLWPARSVDAVGSLLQAAALAPVMGVFVLASLGGPAIGAPGFEQGVLFALGIAAGVATAGGGILATIKRHPRFAVGGGGVGFLASVILLFEFSARGPAGFLGQLVALGGLLAAAFPIARGVIAWVELENVKKDARGKSARTGKDAAAPVQDASGPRAP